MWAQPAPTIQAAALALTAAILAAAACRASWKSLLQPERTHWWCASILCIVLLRSMDTMPIDGLRLHLLGTTLAYVVFGLPFALLAEGIAGAALTLSGQEPVSQYAFNFLLRGALPLAAAWSIFRVMPHERRLASSFIARIGAAFLAGACASVLVTGVAVLSSGPGVWKQMASDEWIAVLVLLTSAEAQLCLLGSVLLLVCGQDRHRDVARARTPLR